MEEQEITNQRVGFTDEEVESLFRFPLTTNYNDTAHFIGRNTVNKSIFRYLGKTPDSSDMLRILSIMNGDMHLRLKLKNVRFTYSLISNKIKINNYDIILLVGIKEIEEMLLKGLFTPREIDQLKKCFYEMITRRLNNSMRKE